MGLFKSIIGKVEEAKQDLKAGQKNAQNNNVNWRSTETSSSSSTSNFEPDFKAKVQDLVMLYYAENYKVDEVKYPEYLRSRYEVGFAKEKLKSLEKRGYIRPSTAAESIPHMKVSNLKEIASQFGIKASGKKEDLCTRIVENVTEEQLAPCIADRFWIVTDEGNAFLDDNRYIKLYLDKHEYSLDSIGLDVFSFSKLYEKKLNGTIRDRLWGEFNRRTMVYFQNAIKTGNFYEYCELLRVMALYLKEEKRYIDSLRQYMRYMFYQENFRAALPALQHYGCTGRVDDNADYLFINAEVLPFMAQEVMSISEGCGFDSSRLSEFMRECFLEEMKANTGIFDEDELTELIMCGLNGDKEGQKAICSQAMNAAMKKMKKR